MSTLRRALASVCILCLFTLLGGSSGAQVADADWLTYNRTLPGDRFSPLKEINRSNVAQLKAICTYTLPEVSSLQTGPLVVDGTMYFTTDEGSYAIDASTCTEKWNHHRHSDTPSMLLVNRGFAYANGRLFRGISDSHVLAMDPADGHVLWDHVIDARGPGVSIPMAPIAANGLVYVGNAGGDQANVTGHVYALDEKDGRMVWRFDVVPGTGSALSTRTNPKYPISGGAFWTSFAFDEPNGILYVPAGNPAPDFDSERRTGDNLYTDSVIAIDAATGRMLAYNQLVKRDSHDWDVDSPPTLATTHSGKRIVASANKDGLLSILDRSQVSRSLPPGDLTSVLPLLSQTPTTTRENVDVPMSRDHPVHFCPGIQGGVEWNGAAFSPETNSLFVAAVDWFANVQVKRNIEVPPTGGLFLGSEKPLSDLFDPPDKAKGWIMAFDADTGKVCWKYQAPHPMLAAVTPTAGGLVFAADLGGQIYGMDVDTGKVLWQTDAGQSTGGWHRHLSRRRTTAHRRGFRNEVAHVAGRRQAEPHSRVRFALIAAPPE